MEDIQKTCCFINTRIDTLSGEENYQYSIYKMFRTELLRRMEGLVRDEKITRFLSGFTLGLEQWAAECVLRLKEQYPAVRLDAVLACPWPPADWLPEQKLRCSKMLAGCGAALQARDSFTEDCFAERNRLMVDLSSIVFALWDGRRDGTEEILLYAKRQDKHVFCINPRTAAMTEEFKKLK